MKQFVSHRLSDSRITVSAVPRRRTGPPVYDIAVYFESFDDQFSVVLSSEQAAALRELLNECLNDLDQQRPQTPADIVKAQEQRLLDEMRSDDA